MRRLLFVLALVSLVSTSSFTPTRAQQRLQPVAAMTGVPALELILRKLDTVGNVMMTTAHPDDENNALLAYYGFTKGFRTSLVTATRGEGGQNEIGPEIFEALAVLRTEELLAVHKFDGAEQYFTRAVDFGYSFSVEETLEKWGGQVILGDYVRMIRTIRPDVIVGFVFDGAGGGQHHQASSLLTSQAFRAAADPNAFPEQITAGLRPWQAKKFYYTAGFGGPGGRGQALQGEGASTLLSFTGGDTYDPILGRTCSELAGEARSMHKCQGMSQLLPLPGVSEGFGSGPRGYRLRDTVLQGGVNRADPEMFDGVDTSLTSLAGYAGPTPPVALTDGLSTIATRVADARTAVFSTGSAEAVAPLAAGLRAVRALRADLKSWSLPASGAYEIDIRLALKETQFHQALVLAADVRLDAVANDNLVVGGQPVQVQIIGANRGRAPVTLAGTLAGFTAATGDCAAAPLAPQAVRNCRMTATVPTDARFTAAHFKYAADAARFDLDPDVPPGLPFRPTPFVATVALTIGGEAVSIPVAVASRSEGNLFSGEKRAELHVVPKFAVTASPEIVIVPATGGTRAARDVRVSVVNHSKGVASAAVVLQAPDGWRVTPATQDVTFSREDEAATVRFTLSPPSPAALAAQVKQGGSRFTVKASVREGGATYAQGYQVVEYPHTTRRHVLLAAEVMVSVLDVRVRPNLTVGYVMGVGDEVPQALEQLGARVELVSEDQLAWGDLSRYDVIMTGVRAYERRADLRANNQRLLDYAKAGGTVVVHYNKFEFNQAQYGPFPGKVTSRRVTDENSPVKMLVPQHPVFTTPNRITANDWKNWRQERGTYFFDPGDPAYTDLVEFDEPFPYNKGAKLGGLVEAKVGTGRWLYLGIGLWRQLPAGTDGAYRLMANILSLGTAPGAARPAAKAPGDR
ncbi:MAG: PIG-L family deacetylase [Acidobacteria bacterium]|nr:PIG-L family deacetylase [Acidobacteriota bacterium]